MHLCRVPTLFHIWRLCIIDFQPQFGEPNRQTAGTAGTASSTLQKIWRKKIYNSGPPTKYYLEFQANMASEKKAIVVIGYFFPAGFAFLPTNTFDVALA